MERVDESPITDPAAILHYARPSAEQSVGWSEPIRWLFLAGCLVVLGGLVFTILMIVASIYVIFGGLH